MTTTETLPEAPARSRVTVPVTLTESRSATGELKLKGLAAPYNQQSLDIGFHEILRPGAFRNGIAPDALLLWQHRMHQPLARLGAGLTITETERGIEFEATLPDTTLARDAVTLVRSGVVRGMSFGFEVLDDTWEQRDGKLIRLVTRASMFEMSLVSQPAYGDHTPVAARNRELAERIDRAVQRMRRAPRTVCPYRSDPAQSYFRDLAVATADSRRLMRGVGDPGFLRDHAHGGAPEALARLKQLDRHLAETRDLTTTATDGGGFIPTGVPAHVADAWAASSRARAALLAALPTPPLPDKGMTVKTPRITTGAPSEIQAAENTAPSTADIVEAYTSSAVKMATGTADVSVQLLERSEPGIDMVIADELSRALAEDISIQLLADLDSTAATSVAYTDTTATAAEFFPKLAEAASRVAEALGRAPDLVAMHPRRLAWLASNLSSSLSLLRDLPYGMTIITDANVSTTYGTPTATEDKVYVLASAELPVYLARPVFEVNLDFDTGSVDGTARLVSRQYFATLFGRQPDAAGTITGTGLVAWYS